LRISLSRPDTRTDGWIFSPDNGNDGILFPCHMRPIAIFHAPARRLPVTAIFY
jgi:hypothetical protein